MLLRCRFLNEHGKHVAVIQVDGNVSVENALAMKAAGADIFVCGTASVFANSDIAANVKTFRAALLKE